MPRTDPARSIEDVDNETADATFWFIGKKQLIPAGAIFDESKIRSSTRHR